MTMPPLLLLHRMVPQHFHASRLFRRLVAPTPAAAGSSSTNSTASSSAMDEWHSAYVTMGSAFNAESDIDFVGLLSTPSSSRTGSPPLPTATPPPSPTTGLQECLPQNEHGEATKEDAKEDKDDDDDVDDDADADDLFERTYWRSELTCAADLHAMVATMVLWGFDAVPEFVHRFYAAAVPPIDEGLADNKFTRMLLRSSCSRAADDAAAAEESVSSAPTRAVADWTSAYQKERRMENKQYDTLALLRRRDLGAEHVLTILEVLVQDRDFRLVAALLRCQTLPRALPLSIHQYLSEFHGAALALCALRNPDLDNPEQTVALATTAMSAVAAGTRRRHLEIHDDLWSAAAAHAERETLLQSFMDLGAPPCVNRDRLASVLCAPRVLVDDDANERDTKFVLCVADYRSYGDDSAWSRAAVRCGNMRLLTAFMARMAARTTTMVREDEDDAAAEILFGLETLVRLSVEAGNSDGLAFLLAWSESNVRGGWALRGKAARAASRVADEWCLREVHRSCEAFQFTVEDTDAAFLATVEKLALSKKRGDHNEDSIVATVCPYVFVRARHAPAPAPAPQRPFMSAVAKFLLAWA